MSEQATASKAEAAETESESKETSTSNATETEKEEKKQLQDNNNNNNDDDGNEDSKTKSSSSYYLYKSTDPEEAKKFAPKKLDPSTAQQVASQVQAKAKGSAWNTGATMETFDYTDWMKERLGALFTGYTFSDSSLKITEVVNIEGHADVLLVRGKYRPGWEISFECKFEGYLDANHKAPVSAELNDSDKDKDKDKEKDKEKAKKDKNKIKGTLKLKEIEDCNDDDDWKWEVSISKGKSKASAKKKVNADKDRVVELVNTVIEELKSKKK